MPKMKTHRAAAKRYWVSGSGKLMRRKSFRKHLLEHKSGSRKRRLAIDLPVNDAILSVVSKELPYPRHLR